MYRSSSKNQRTREISCERKKRKKEEKKKKLKGYFVRERLYGSLQQMIAMPADITEKDAKATFKNGVLEVRFKKTKISPKSRIEIE